MTRSRTSFTLPFRLIHLGVVTLYTSLFVVILAPFCVNVHRFDYINLAPLPAPCLYKAPPPLAGLARNNPEFVGAMGPH